MIGEEFPRVHLVAYFLKGLVDVPFGGFSLRVYLNVLELLVVCI